MHALRSGRFKLIDAPRPELYDLEDDPFEERNIYDGHPTVAKPMAARLASMAATLNAPGASDQRIEATPELRAQLGALGYVSAAVTSGRRIARARIRRTACADTRALPMHRTRTPTAVRGDLPTILPA